MVGMQIFCQREASTVSLGRKRVVIIYRLAAAMRAELSIALK
jgi:hypothetical protein